MVSNYSDPLIKQNKREALRKSVYYVMPSAKSYKERKLGGKVIYETYNSSDELIGYAFTASGGGYQGTIRLMVGVGPNLEEIKGIQVLESSETPGLGGKIRGKPFKSQFRGLQVERKVGLVKAAKPGKGEIQAITGATISSRAVVDIINKDLERVRSLLSEGE